MSRDTSDSNSASGQEGGTSQNGRGPMSARELQLISGLFLRSPIGACLLEAAAERGSAAASHVIIDVNDAWARITGVPRSKAVGRTFEEVHPGIARIWFAFSRLFVQGMDEDYFEEYIPEFGRHLWMHTAMIVPGVLGLHMADVSDRYRLAQGRAADNAMMRAMLNSTRDLIGLYDAEMRLVMFNDAFEETMHLLARRPIIPGMRVVEHVDEAIRAQWQGMIVSAMRGEFVHNLWQYDGPDGARIYDLQLYPVSREYGIAGFVAYSRDVTALKESERSAIEARDEALRAVALKENFIATLSHEIRTPLNIILGYLGIIDEELASARGSDYGDMLQSIDDAGRRLMRTIDLTLDLSRINTGNHTVSLSHVRVQPLISRLIAERRRMVDEKGLLLVFNTNVPHLVLNTDAYLLTQVIDNLVDNAVKYTHKGGITVRLERGDDGTTTIHIADTGIGISADYLPHLFTPYTQEDTGYTRAYEGIGLGLALVRRYLDVLGLPIRVESLKDAGTTFTIDVTAAVVP